MVIVSRPVVDVGNNLLFRSLVRPGQVFREISHPGSPLTSRLLKLSILLVLLPPLFSWIGAGIFGWRLGAEEPLFFDSTLRTVISMFYGISIAFGLCTTVLLGRWMAATYGASTSVSVHFAFFTVVSLPLALASAAHLYPNVFFNVVVLIPTLVWCMNLLYRGLPVVMGIPVERGMLMASALVGWLLVAAVSLLGISVGLWTNGIGPALGV